VVAHLHEIGLSVHESREHPLHPPGFRHIAPAHLISSRYIEPVALRARYCSDLSALIEGRATRDMSSGAIHEIADQSRRSRRSRDYYPRTIT
jgi:hypothetical protein